MWGTHSGKRPRFQGQGDAAQHRDRPAHKRGDPRGLGFTERLGKPPASQPRSLGWIWKSWIRQLAPVLGSKVSPAAQGGRFFLHQGCIRVLEPRAILESAHVLEERGVSSGFQLAVPNASFRAPLKSQPLWSPSGSEGRGKRLGEALPSNPPLSLDSVTVWCGNSPGGSSETDWLRSLVLTLFCSCVYISK